VAIEFFRVFDVPVFAGDGESSPVSSTLLVECAAGHLSFDSVLAGRHPEMVVIET
jgi:hypothetical protein